MPGTLTRDDTGLWFWADSRRYHILSPVQLDRHAQLRVMLALYNGQGNGCLLQDEANISVARGRKAFARSCQAFDEETIAADLLDLDAELRKAIAQEAKARGQPRQESAPPPRCGSIEEGDLAYDRVRTERDGTEVRTPVSSFIVVPKVRVWLDGAEAIRADLKTATQLFGDITFERHHWHSRSLFLKALPSLDLWCVASDNEIQHIQAIVAAKKVPRKQGTRALGSYDGGLWVTEEGVLSATGWMADPPVLYLPHSGESPLAGRVRYRTADVSEGHRVAEAFYARVWTLNDLRVIGPTIGWFFATLFKPQVQCRFKHFPILNCWGTGGPAKPRSCSSSGSSSAWSRNCSRAPRRNSPC